MDNRIIAVDLDGTLAHYDGWKGIDHIGEPVIEIRRAVRQAFGEGAIIHIFTARMSDPEEAKEAYVHITRWLKIHDVPYHGITAIKQKFFTEFWDDRAIQVIKNQGVFVMSPDSIHKAPLAPVFLPDVNASNHSLGGEEASPPESALDVQVGGDHYKKWKIQPIEFAHANNMPFLDANAFKYICRHADKNGVQDLRKAKHYLELIAEMVYGEKL